MDELPCYWLSVQEQSKGAAFILGLLAKFRCDDTKVLQSPGMASLFQTSLCSTAAGNGLTEDTPGSRPRISANHDSDDRERTSGALDLRLASPTDVAA